jgi:hypothetical protein
LPHTRNKMQHEIRKIIFAVNQEHFDVSYRIPSLSAASQVSYFNNPSFSASSDVLNLSDMAWLKLNYLNFGYYCTLLVTHFVSVSQTNHFMSKKCFFVQINKFVFVCSPSVPLTYLATLPVHKKWLFFRNLDKIMQTCLRYHLANNIHITANPSWNGIAVRTLVFIFILFGKD